ncbi:N-formyl peptide receptor 3-like [Gigantopelta aegis]|uniref:N-formyl peptide receptor 3-like n=1 Tax=Gigantopelta aegis TaxID=1735272 RepID=UPI001B887BFF|nr:N-formyl peptide receptor 3-like [Gigantopelta aegis]
MLNTTADYTNDASSSAVEPDISETTVTAVIGILSVLSVFGTFGNGLVLYVFSHKVDKVTSTIFILALAGTDFITCILIIPFTVVYIGVNNWLMYDFLCKLYQFLITCNVPLSAFIMVAIGIDRYLCICHPFKHAMTPRRANIAIFSLSMFAFLLGSMTSLIYSVYEPRNVVANDTSEGFVYQTVRPFYNNNNNYNNTIISAGSGLHFHTSSADNSSMVVSPIAEETINKSEQIQYVYTGKCNHNNRLLSQSIIEIYQKVYASFFLIAILIVSVLYALIYRSVIKRRKWRFRQRSMRPSCNEKTVDVSKATHLENNEEVELCTKSATNGLENDHDERANLNHSKKISKSERKDFNRLANIRTAAMLFVVNVVFILAFLPSWLMAHRLIDFNMVVFYMYFVYNVANPVIYAFMNVAFRKELKAVFTRGSKCMR